MLVAEKSYLEAYSPKVIERKKTTKKKAKKFSKNVRMLILISVFFVIGFTIVLRYAALTELSNSLNKQKQFLSGLEKSKSQLKTDILIDLNTVDDIATNKLAMNRPYSYQVKYINLNETSADAVVAQNTESKFDIVKKLSKVVEFLY